MTWFDPRTWVVREGITATKLNEISSNLNHLKNPPKSLVTVHGGGTNITTTSTTVTPVDDVQFAVSLDLTEGRDVEIILSGVVAHTVLSGFVIFDVIIDEAIWASSLTATPVTAGISKSRETLAAAEVQLTYSPIIIEDLDAGVHTFKLRWKLITAGTATLVLNGALFQFGVIER